MPKKQASKPKPRKYKAGHCPIDNKKLIKHIMSKKGGNIIINPPAVPPPSTISISQMRTGI